MKELVRSIQGIRIECPVCNKTVTPLMIISNDEKSGLTMDIAWQCPDCKGKTKANVKKPEKEIPKVAQQSHII
jgi:C4-type Zn-finger protein